MGYRSTLVAPFVLSHVSHLSESDVIDPTHSRPLASGQQTIRPSQTVQAPGSAVTRRGVQGRTKMLLNDGTGGHHL